MSHFLKIKDSAGEYVSHKVPAEVYVYVRQLECAREYPAASNLSNPLKSSRLIHLFPDESERILEMEQPIWGEIEEA